MIVSPSRAVAMAAALALAGCGPGGPRVGTVTGRAAVGGTPLPNGTLTFVPEDDSAPTAGCEIVGGRYTATVPVGRARVEVHSFEAIRPARFPDPGEYRDRVPERFGPRSELRIDVKVGSNEFDLDLPAR